MVTVNLTNTPLTSNNLISSETQPHFLPGMVGPSEFTKTICSICYEDLKPIVEDLQAISVCGHVFHELCLQQWFEYSTNKKKHTCPVCKQGCTEKNVGRLYFQSIGDAVATQCPSQSQNPRINRDDGDCPELLRIEVKKLEAKVSGLGSALEVHQKEVKQLNDELHICKDQLSKEVILKNEALRQKGSLQAMLQTKSSDLVKSTLECSRLQEKNLALVKELAALKLVSDCNLEEEEIVKLASIGHEGRLQDAIVVLKKSLVIRNKSYKDLMAKCNSLGRGEARSLRKLEKANEKIIKLKTRVQELETAIEAKENEVLRSLKASKRRNCDDATLPTVNRSTNCPSLFKLSPIKQKDQTPPSVINLDEEGDDNPFQVEEKNRKCTSNKYIGDNSKIEHQEVLHYDCLIDEKHEPDESLLVHLNTNAHYNKEGSDQTLGSSRSADSDSRGDSKHQPNHPYGLSGLPGNGNDVVNESLTVKEAPVLVLHDIRQIQPSVHTKPEACSPIPRAEPGDRCFAGGLLGPDGANRYLGKWCKRAQNNAPKGSMPGSSNATDSLIAVGADGRGGTVKVLRPLDQRSTDPKESVISAKRFKPGAKSSSLQTQGCLQIEHFFGKARS